jgi:hypothetical protein
MRVFEGDEVGRLYVRPAGFQELPPEHRLGVRIGGEPVAEVDVKASHLTLALGLLGEMIPPDPYAFPGLPREAVKKWAVARLSTGKAPSRWPQDTPASIRAVRAGAVTKAVYSRWPALESLEGNWRRWQALEAKALLRAMELLSVPALPVYDALVVPQSAAEEARQAICEGYEGVARVSQRVEIRRLPAPQVSDSKTRRLLYNS